MRDHHQHRSLGIALAVALLVIASGPASAAGPAAEPLFHDSHFHLTNYVQKGTDMGKYVDEIMGDKVRRSTVFGIPLQQTWSYGNSGDFAPTYYLQSDAPLYYYSFTDAWIASQYLKLKPEQRRRLDPMITGFNPADMYAADHIRRVLETYPGVFTGIGEFTIHKEFVSSKVAGDTASLTDPALDRVLDFAGGACLSDADAGAAASPPENHDHLGPPGTRPRCPPGAGPGEHRHGRAQPQVPRNRRLDPCRSSAEPRLFRHFLG
jgi:hypothetical protein